MCIPDMRVEIGRSLNRLLASNYQGQKRSIVLTHSGGNKNTLDGLLEGTGWIMISY